VLAVTAQLKAVGLSIAKTGSRSHYTVTFPELIDEGWADVFRSVFYGDVQ
jgi:hypothetical protein